MSGETHVTRTIKTLLIAAGEQGVTMEEAYYRISKEFSGQGCNRQHVSKVLHNLHTKTSKAYPQPFAERVPGTKPLRYRVRGCAPKAEQSPLLTPKEHPHPSAVTFWNERQRQFVLKQACIRR